MGDTKFHFRIRCTAPYDKKLNEIHQKYNQFAPIALSVKKHEISLLLLQKL